MMAIKNQRVRIWGKGQVRVRLKRHGGSTMSKFSVVNMAPSIADFISNLSVQY